MVKRLGWWIAALSVVWLGKVSYDVLQLTKQLPVLSQELRQSEQKNATLNDQLVALQRQVVSPDATTPASSVAESSNGQLSLPQTVGIHPLILVEQQLELVEFALQQQKYLYALENLNELEKNLGGYLLAEALQKSLALAIQQDKVAIEKFMQARQEQQAQIDDVLHELDALIQQSLKAQSLNPAALEPEHFWQKWLQIDSVPEASVNLVNRSLILKEVQLRVLHAQQALGQGEYTEYQQSLVGIQQQLNLFPDQASQLLNKKIEFLKGLTAISVPKLNAKALLN